MNDKEFEEVLHKFRDEPPSVLQFQPPIDLLMDGNYCQGVAAAIHKAGVNWERMNAVNSLGNMLPAESGLYMFVWRPSLMLKFETPPEIEKFSWVLYVGKAGTEEGKNATIKQRYLTEYSKYVGKDASLLWEQKETKNREQRLARYLTLRPLEYWYLTMSNIQDILILEKKLIRLLAPPLNSQYGPKLRPSGKPTDAFKETT